MYCSCRVRSKKLVPFPLFETLFSSQATKIFLVFQGLIPNPLPPGNLPIPAGKVYTFTASPISQNCEDLFMTSTYEDR